MSLLYYVMLFINEIWLRSNVKQKRFKKKLIFKHKIPFVTFKDLLYHTLFHEKFASL